MRIGFFSDDYYPEASGVSRTIQLQMKELQRLGHEPFLFVPSRDFIPPANIPYETLPAWHLPVGYFDFMKFDKRSVEHITDKYSFDLIHSHTERGAMLLGARISKVMNIPQVHTFHTNFVGAHSAAPLFMKFNTITNMQISPKTMQSYAKSTRELRPAIRQEHNDWQARSDWRTFARWGSSVDQFTSPAAFMVDEIVSASGGALQGYGHVVPNGLDTELFLNTERKRPDDGKIRFICSGRLSKEKRIDVIIRAFADLQQENIELHILGEGPEHKNLRQLADKVVTKGKVVFLGKYDERDRIAQVHADADVFVFASYHFDTQGMVLVEAGCTGLPIIYCDERLKAGVTSENALLTDRPDVASFTAAMRTLIQDVELRKKLGKASPEIAREYDIERTEQLMLSVYQKALAESKR